MLALGDVHANADHSRRLTVFVREHLALAVHPAKAARARSTAKLGLVVGARFDAATDGDEHALAIVGVNHRLVSFEGASKAARSKTMDGLEVLRPPDLTRSDVPFPASHLAGLECEEQTSLVSAQ